MFYIYLWHHCRVIYQANHPSETTRWSLITTNASITSITKINQSIFLGFGSVVEQEIFQVSTTIKEEVQSEGQGIIWLLFHYAVLCYCFFKIQQFKYFKKVFPSVWQQWNKTTSICFIVGSNFDMSCALCCQADVKAPEISTALLVWCHCDCFMQINNLYSIQNYYCS